MTARNRGKSPTNDTAVSPCSSRRRCHMLLSPLFLFRRCLGWVQPSWLVWFCT